MIDAVSVVAIGTAPTVSVVRGGDVLKHGVVPLGFWGTILGTNELKPACAR
jgi:hypothetical protein